MKQRFVIGVLVVLALLTVGFSAQAVFAQTGTTAATGTAGASGTAMAGSFTPQTFTVAAGQSVSIPANFWCLDFGKPFPTGVTGPKNQAAANVFNVLAAAAQQGTTTSNPYQTQLAVWYAADNTWHDQASQGHTTAQALVSAAGNANAGSNSQALGQLASNGGLTVTVQGLTAVPDTANSQTPYHGTGTVVVQNTGSQSVNFSLDGAVFLPTDANAQTLVAQTSNQAATATAEPTETAMAAATATMMPTETAVVAAATETATPAPTATVAPTETVAATAAVTETATAAATPATLPTTGAGDANGWMSVALVLGALILFAGFGLGFRRASK